MRTVECIICKRMLPLDKAFRSWKRWWTCSKHCWDVFQKVGNKLLGRDKKIHTLKFKDK